MKFANKLMLAVTLLGVGVQQSVLFSTRQVIMLHTQILQ